MAGRRKGEVMGSEEEEEWDTEGCIYDMNDDMLQDR